MKPCRPEFVLPGGGPRLMLVALLAGGLSVAGAASTGSTIQYDLRVWQTDDGLPQNSVSAIAQTPDGYLWIGTPEGLVRFDGVRFVSLDEDRFPQLKQARVSALCAARDGCLWIGCDGGGVFRLQDGKTVSFSVTNGLPSNQVRCLAEGKDGSMWIGTEAGLSHFKDGKFKNWTEKEGLPDGSVRSVCEAAQGILRIATRSGLYSLNERGQISTNNFGLGPIASALRSVWVDRTGKLWLGATDGLLLATGDEGKPVNRNFGFGSPVITTIFEDHQSQLWVGTYGGLIRLIDGKVVPWRTSGTPFSDLVNVIFEDREANLWIGARDGLCRLEPARFTSLTTQQGLSANNVMSVCEDRKGAIWIATWGGGVNRLEDGTLTVIRSTNGLTHDAVLSLCEARDGRMWAGMDFGAGLNRLNDQFKNDFSKPEGFIYAAVRVIHEDRTGALWIGTSKGLNILREGVLETYNATNGLAGNLVMDICETRDGNVWIGTDGGLNRWNGSAFERFTQLSNDLINVLYEDRDGALWIGTKTGGLNCLSAGKFTAYTTRNGLFSDEMFEVIEDDLEFLWMTCRRGLFRVSKKEFLQLDRGSITRLNCTVFGREDGLATVQFNGVSKPAGWKASDGRLWFPSIRGVVAVETRIKTNENPPPVAIEEIVADRQALRPPLPLAREGAPLAIPAGTREIEIHYTALSFQSPEKNRFKYKLEGIDTDWVDAGRRRVANYHRIQPGHYRFRVLGCNNDGVWNETGAATGLRVLPHYWQTWWFRAVLVLGAALLLAGFYRSRVARLREIERLRIQIASDLHDDVGARLTKVAMVTESLDLETPAGDHSKSHIQKIAGTVREITLAMDEIVWTINPRNDTLDHLANYIFKYAQDYFQHTGVRCRLDLPAELPDHPISTEERHHLFMAVKEALNNILKHAGASEVRVALSVAENALTIIITDNGRGVAPGPATAAGDGLLNMKERLQQIGGRMEFESKPGVGTTITMELRGKWMP